MTPEVESRFWPKTERGQNGCIIWIGALSDGYGQLGVDGKRRYAHRLAYEHFIGPVPVGLELDHKCRVRACVNPWHLEPVTAKENVLRGEGLCGVNARKTHCVHGHEFTPANTYSSPTWPGRRECRTCKRRLGRAWDRQHRRVASPRGGETA